MTPSPILIIFAAVYTLSAVALFFQVGMSDFVLFYQAGQDWWTGHPLYTRSASNLNPPLTVVALFAPLATLSLPAARAVWFTLSLIAVMLSVRIVAKECQWTRSQTLTMTAALMVTYPAWLAWYQGQLVWVLALPATLSWQAYRHGKLKTAGLWFAPVLALKPPFALVALFLPVPIWLTAFVGGTVLTEASILVTGLGPWEEWWAFRDHVFWITWVDNLSLTGQFGRVLLREVWQVRLSDLPWFVPVLVFVLGIAAYIRTAIEDDPDRRMAMAWLSGVLISPIGWVYYLVTGLAPLLASARPNVIGPWLLFCVPFLVFYPIARGPLAWVVGSIYSIAAVWAWMAWSAQQDEQDQRHQDAQEHDLHGAVPGLRHGGSIDPAA